VAATHALVKKIIAMRVHVFAMVFNQRIDKCRPPAIAQQPHTRWSQCHQFWILLTSFASRDVLAQNKI
jgi:hypothetical protein